MRAPLAAALGGTVEGDPEAKVSSFAKIEHGRPGQLCFFANPKYEKYVYTSKASVLLVNCDFEPKEKVTPLEFYYEASRLAAMFKEGHLSVQSDFFFERNYDRKTL